MSARVTTSLDTLCAGLSEEERAVLAGLDAVGAEMISRDDAVGVQKRFDPVLLTFTVCLAHEMRRGIAKGIAPAVLFDGLEAVLAKLIRNVAINALAHLTPAARERATLETLAAQIGTRALVVASTLAKRPEAHAVAPQQAEIRLGGVA